MALIRLIAREKGTFQGLEWRRPFATHLCGVLWGNKLRGIATYRKILIIEWGRLTAVYNYTFETNSVLAPPAILFLSLFFLETSQMSGKQLPPYETLGHYPSESPLEGFPPVQPQPECTTQYTATVTATADVRIFELYMHDNCGMWRL